MPTLPELWPIFGLRVRAGALTLRAIRDDDLPEVLAMVQSGIHEPERMPFSFPWTDATGTELVTNTLQHYWRGRAELTAQKWSLELGVWLEDRFVGVQSVSTEDFPVTRTGETGSWLGLSEQGRGIGTAMRRAICALCFDHLGFTEVTSGAFLDNPASLAVSRKVGYLPNGLTRYRRRDRLAVNQGLVLTAETFVRGSDPVRVEGAEAVRRLLGIETKTPDGATT